MAKRLFRFSLRLLFLNVVAFLIGLIVMMPLIGLVKEESSFSPAFKWIISIMFTFLWFVFIWFDSGNAAQKSIQQDKIIHRRVSEEGYTPRGDEGRLYTPSQGFLAGLLSQAPAIAVIVVSFFFGLQDWPTLVLKGWYILFFQSYVAFDAALPYLFLAYPLLLSCVSGLAYLTGPAQQRRLETIIERNKARKAKRVQDDLKNKRNASKKNTLRR